MCIRDSTCTGLSIYLITKQPEYLLQAGEVERERLRVRSKEINSTSTYRQSKTTQLNLRQFIESRGKMCIRDRRRPDRSARRR